MQWDKNRSHNSCKKVYNYKSIYPNIPPYKFYSLIYSFSLERNNFPIFLSSNSYIWLCLLSTFLIPIHRPETHVTCNNQARKIIHRHTYIHAHTDRGWEFKIKKKNSRVKASKNLHHITGVDVNRNDETFFLYILIFSVFTVFVILDRKVWLLSPRYKVLCYFFSSSSFDFI